jgi:hypothetical protein
VRPWVAIIVATAIWSGIAGVASAETITFERDVVGVAPSDFDSCGTADAGPGQCAVMSDDRVRVGQRHFETVATFVLMAEGNRILVARDGQPLLAATDATFPSAGRIALSTTADSVTRFDQLEFKPLP